MERAIRHWTLWWFFGLCADFAIRAVINPGASLLWQVLLCGLNGGIVASELSRKKP